MFIFLRKTKCVKSLANPFNQLYYKLALFFNYCKLQFIVMTVFIKIHISPIYNLKTPVTKCFINIFYVQPDCQAFVRGFLWNGS